jgi:hypothetical protein
MQVGSDHMKEVEKESPTASERGSAVSTPAEFPTASSTISSGGETSSPSAKTVFVSN